MPITPHLCGRETEIRSAMAAGGPYWSGQSPLQLDQLRSGFACALHMHQPTIPAGPDGALISHLQYMLEHPGEGDNHNAEPFAQCYRRLADLIPQLIEQGCSPRIMLDISGNLLWGAEQMGRRDITEAWRYLACDPEMQRHVEWLGTFWGHAVAPSTPIPDLRLQIEAWQHQFAAAFGLEALQRVRGFSLPEMALPNHPDTLFALVEAMQQAGYRIVPVNPKLDTTLGEACHADLRTIEADVDIVNLFRASEHVTGHVDEILALEPRPRAVWMQLGIHNGEAAQRLREAGIGVIQDRCIMVDHRRLLGSSD